MEGKKRFAGFLHPQAKQIVLKLIYYFNQDDGITRNVEQRVSEALGVSFERKRQGKGKNQGRWTGVKERSLKPTVCVSQKVDIRDVISRKNSCHFVFVKGCLKATGYSGY